MTGDLLLVAATFLACAVEAVEALTIVLAMGLTRGWRSALQGVAAGLLVLSVTVVVLGPVLVTLPLDSLRLVVGGLLLVFGLAWLRKAILRASGFKAMHDEESIYSEQVVAARAASTTSHLAVHDWYAFTLAFKAVTLEGLEVVFIVLTFGANQNNVPLAAVGAVLAVVGVSLAGLLVRGPLARVPENTLKYVVGVLLTTFGTFWAVEGAGVDWPGGDAALPVLLALFGAVAIALTGVLSSARRNDLADSVAKGPS